MAQRLLGVDEHVTGCDRGDSLGSVIVADSVQAYAAAIADASTTPVAPFGPEGFFAIRRTADGRSE